MNSVMIGGYAAAAVLFWLWLGARDDLASQIKQCNTQKITAVAEAERITREALQDASQAREEALAQRLRQVEIARQRATEAAEQAMNRPVEVREVIQRVTDPQSCLNQPVPDDVIVTLRGES